jgi:hypothetical protein
MALPNQILTIANVDQESDRAILDMVMSPIRLNAGNNECKKKDCAQYD